MISAAACSGNLKYLDNSNSETDIYSMLLSAKKYVKGAEQKIFFVAIPLSFKIKAKRQGKTIHFDFPNADNDKSNLRTLIETSGLIEKSNFAPLFSFDFDAKPNSLVLDFENFLPNFEIEFIKWYRNATFRDLQVKLTHKLTKEVLYITLDFFDPKDEKIKERESFEDFFSRFSKK